MSQIPENIKNMWLDAANEPRMISEPTQGSHIDSLIEKLEIENEALFLVIEKLVAHLDEDVETLVGIKVPKRSTRKHMVQVAKAIANLRPEERRAEHDKAAAYFRKSNANFNPERFRKASQVSTGMHSDDYQKESVEQIDEISKATKDSYVAKRGSQLSSMLSGHTRGKQLTGKQQANAVKGIKRAMAVKMAVKEAKHDSYDDCVEYYMNVKDYSREEARNECGHQKTRGNIKEAHIGKSGFPTQDERTFADRIKLGAKLDARGETKGAEKRAWRALDRWAQRKAAKKNSVKEETLLEKFKRVSSEIRHLIKDKGYPQKRAVAAALSMKREGKLSEEKTKDTYDPRAAQAIANAYRERRLKNKKKKKGN